MDKIFNGCGLLYSKNIAANLRDDEFENDDDDGYEISHVSLHWRFALTVNFLHDISSPLFFSFTTYIYSLKEKTKKK